LKQSRTMSLVEAVTNVIVGFLIALVTQIAVFPLFGLQVSIADDLLIGAIFMSGPLRPARAKCAHTQPSPPATDHQVCLSFTAKTYLNVDARRCAGQCRGAWGLENQPHRIIC
jgi:hypothetical protein